MKAVYYLLIGLIIVPVLSNNGLFAQEVSKIAIDESAQRNKNQYFSTQNNASQLTNYLGTKFLIFEFPGKSAETLYKSCIDLFKDYTDKIELVKNRSIDSYNSIKIDHNVTIGSVSPINLFYYNYMVSFEDSKVIIENPYIYTEYQTINLSSGDVTSEYLSIADYITYLDNSITNSKGKRLQERTELVSFFKSSIKTGYNEIIGTINNFTDSLLKRAASGQNFDSSIWIADLNPPKFELTPNGLVSDSKRDYIIIKTPDNNVESAKLKTSSLINFLYCDFPLEYYRSLIGNRFEFYERRGISAYVLDAYFGQGVINFSDFYLKDDFGDFKRFRVKKTISSSKNALGEANFTFDITYVPGYVKISIPKISKIVDGQYDWMNKENGYKSIFSTPSNKVLQPECKLAVEKYFNELVSFLYKYYSQD